MKKWLRYVLVAGVISGGCTSTGPNRSARRYLDPFEISKRSPHTAETALTDIRFQLLARPEVQGDLHLTMQQIFRVESIINTPVNQSPELKSFINERKKKRESLSGADKEKYSRGSLHGFGMLLNRHNREQLESILTANQTHRLDQLVMQALGPVLIVVQTNLAHTLQISETQKIDMNRLVRESDKEIVPILREFGMNFISGRPSGETREDRRRTMKNQIEYLEKELKERDENLLGILSASQHQVFSGLQGKPLAIEWNPWDIMAIPFQKEGLGGVQRP